jgi:hypothetical protein
VSGRQRRVAELDDRLAPGKQVADAVLYEGYVLYPYRASARKNQMRWQFGVLAPEPFVAGGSGGSGEASSMQTEMILEAGAQTRLHLRLRALQVQTRTVERLEGDGAFVRVESLDTPAQLWTSFDEAVEHRCDVVDVAIDELAAGAAQPIAELRCAAVVETEPIPDGLGRIVRQRWPVSAQLSAAAVRDEGPYPLVKLTVRIDNVTDWTGPAETRDDVVRRSLVAVHLLMAIDGGRFVSMLDPPEFARPAVASCTNVGTFPVLISDDVVLSSPIILYDHPAVAPESEGDMFDATEIDEILALRVLTLTDDEKREARGTDPRSAAIVDRCDQMGPDAFGALHGTFRSLRPPSNDQVRPWWEPAVDAQFDPWTDTVAVGATAVSKGTRVRLRPSRRADAQDLFVAGLPATVAGVFHDVDDSVHVAVVLDDDPAADLHQWQGRYLYFHPDEIEICEGGP